MAPGGLWACGGGGGAQAPVPALPSLCCGLTKALRAQWCISPEPRGFLSRPAPTRQRINQARAHPPTESPKSASFCLLPSSRTGLLVLLGHTGCLWPQGLGLPGVWKDPPRGSARPTLSYHSSPGRAALGQAGQPSPCLFPCSPLHRPASPLKQGTGQTQRTNVVWVVRGTQSSQFRETGGGRGVPGLGEGRTSRCCFTAQSFMWAMMESSGNAGRGWLLNTVNALHASEGHTQTQLRW